MIFIGDSRFRAPHESPFEHLTASRSTKSLSNVCVMNSFFLWRCFVTSRSDACYFAMARRVVAEQHVFGKIAAELVSDLCFCVHDCLWITSKFIDASGGQRQPLRIFDESRKNMRDWEKAHWDKIEWRR